MGFLVAESAAAPFLVLAGIFGFRPFPISGVQSGTPASFGFLVYTRYMEFLALFLIAARFMAQMMSFLVKYICFCRKEIYFFKPSFMSSFLSRTGSLRFMDLHEIFF